MSDALPIFDAHLDMAMNAVMGRDVTQPAARQPPHGDEIATVGLPDLRRGGVKHFCGTIFCLPDSPKERGYRDAEEAHAQTLEQIAVYHRLEAAGEISIVGRPNDRHTALGMTILIEGADGIRTPGDLPMLIGAGVRIVGLSWKATRYAGGTGQPGPLTSEGQTLVRAMDQLKLIHDVSHLAEQSFWELLDCTAGSRVIASHSNCRAIVGDDPNERHLSDEMIKALVSRNAVIGINFYDRFLLPASEYGKRRATLADVVAHIRHVCDLARSAQHVAIGTDMDGGLGREQIPVEIDDSGDLPLLAEALADGGFDKKDVADILYNNWARVLLPESQSG